MKNRVKNLASYFAPLLGAVALFGCTTVAEPTERDPYESLNRSIFEFNRVVDGIILRPIASGYGEVMPEQGKVMVSNFVSNIKEPVTFANSVLQADPTNSFASLWRFMLNSTFGLAGLFDVATALGLADRETGFGDTLSIYGADSGPYFVIPIIGPSTTRDSFGRLGDVFLDPISYTSNPIFYSVVGVKTLDTRYHKLKLLDSVYSTSLDPYATLRSLYLQHRDAEVAKAKKQRKKSQDAAFSGSAK